MPDEDLIELGITQRRWQKAARLMDGDDGLGLERAIIQASAEDFRQNGGIRGLRGILTVLEERGTDRPAAHARLDEIQRRMLPSRLHDRWLEKTDGCDAGSESAPPYGGPCQLSLFNERT